MVIKKKKQQKLGCRDRKKNRVIDGLDEVEVVSIYKLVTKAES